MDVARRRRRRRRMTIAITLMAMETVISIAETLAKMKIMMMTRRRT